MMSVLRSEALPLKSTADIVNMRQAVRRYAVEAGFSLVDQTKLVTAASEVARNTVVYGLGGSAILEIVNNDTRKGVHIVFEDSGPGIADVTLAMKDGYTTGTGLGLGLGGAKRLVNEFRIDSRRGEGTRVELTRWK
jgi:serine/threonine-protein kinase RsbT